MISSYSYVALFKAFPTQLHVKGENTTQVTYSTLKCAKKLFKNLQSYRLRNKSSQVHHWDGFPFF